MYFSRGRPRFWIPAYDRIHLVIPALLGLVAVLLATAPPAPQPAISRVEPRPIRPAVVIAILSPVSGAQLEPRQLPRIDGVAPPGAVISLLWFDRPIGQPTRAGPLGRWSFRTEGFPPGQHLLRAVGRWDGGGATSAPVIFTLQAPPVSSGSPRKKTGR